jgi:hypothetical protein
MDQATEQTPAIEAETAEAARREKAIIVGVTNGLAGKKVHYIRLPNSQGEDHLVFDTKKILEKGRFDVIENTNSTNVNSANKPIDNAA